jgi:hypothetical protein
MRRPRHDPGQSIPSEGNPAAGGRSAGPGIGSRRARRRVRSWGGYRTIPRVVTAGTSTGERSSRSPEDPPAQDGTPSPLALSAPRREVSGTSANDFKASKSRRPGAAPAMPSARSPASRPALAPSAAARRGSPRERSARVRRWAGRGGVSDPARAIRGGFDHSRDRAGRPLDRAAVAAWSRQSQHFAGRSAPGAWSVAADLRVVLPRVLPYRVLENMPTSYTLSNRLRRSTC